MAANTRLNLEFHNDWPDDCDLELKVFNILATYLPHDSKVSATRAAEAIHSLFLASIEEGFYPGGTLEMIWDEMFLNVLQLDYDGVPMQRLLDLIKAISELPGEAMQDEDGEPRLWEDLPIFSMCVTERWVRKLHHHKRRGVTSGKSHGILKSLVAEVEWRPSTPEGIRQFKNFAGFLALLAAEDGGGFYSMLSIVSEALETCHRGSVEESMLAALVPAAAFWFTQCRARIDRACEARERPEGDARGPLWKGAPGFSPERRRFWMERFEEIALRGDVEESTKSACIAAIQSGFQLDLCQMDL
jgi:hypothetical protein